MSPGPPIYLDNNSTTPIHPEVVDSMARAWKELPGNPASQHSVGRKARRVLEEAREGIVALLGGKTGGIDADKLIFTSGGTEANQLAVRGLVEPAATGAEARADERLRVMISAIEHPGVRGAAEALAREGFVVGKLPVQSSGAVNVAELAGLLSPGTKLVSVMLANHETGVLQPMEEIAKLCSAANIPLHTDAVQAVGKLPVHFRKLGVTALTLTPHKFHGPLGIGGLLLRQGARLQPLFQGGFQQAGLRPGTECVALVIGFYTALVMADRELAQRQQRMTELRTMLEQLLLAGAPDGVLIGSQSERLPTTTSIAFPGINRQALVMALDMAGVACSTGSACASGSSEPSPVLLAMGLPKEVVEGSIRLSLGAFTTTADVQEGARRILKAVNQLRPA